VEVRAKCTAVSQFSSRVREHAGNAPMNRDWMTRVDYVRIVAERRWDAECEKSGELRARCVSCYAPEVVDRARHGAHAQTRATCADATSRREAIGARLINGLFITSDSKEVKERRINGQ